jgi:hypothetical protein
MGQPNTRRTFRLASIASLALVATVIPLQGTAATVVSTSWVPKDPPSIYDPTAGPNAIRSVENQNDICSTDTQLDCLEKVEAFIGGTWVAGTLTGQLGLGGTTEWKIPGLVNEDGKDLVEVSNSINYTGNIFHQVDVFSTSIDGFRRPWESGLKVAGCALAADQCVRYGNLQADIPFRVSYRSSWVLPTALSAKLTNAKVTVEKLAESGASRVTVEGIPLLGMGIDAKDESVLTDPNGKGLWLSRNFSVSMIDGRFFPMKKECIDKPTLTVADNAWNHSIPTFENNRLELKIQSPHLRPDGEVHRGIYEAFIPLESAQCLWGNTIALDSQFEVSVIDPNTGNPKPSQPSVTATASGFTIEVQNFTYSTPIIRVAPLPRPKRPSRVSVSSSRKSISTSFARVAGTKYAATATKGTVTKKLKCSSTKTRVTCSVKKLKKGTWTLSIVPTKNQVKGIAYTKRVRVK